MCESKWHHLSRAALSRSAYDEIFRRPPTSIFPARAAAAVPSLKPESCMIAGTAWRPSFGARSWPVAFSTRFSFSVLEISEARPPWFPRVMGPYGPLARAERNRNCLTSVRTEKACGVYPSRGFHHETNTFVKTPTDFAYFASHRDRPPLVRRGDVLNGLNGVLVRLSGFPTNHGQGARHTSRLLWTI